MQMSVLGGDGYLGWPTALHLSARGHDVAVADNFARRDYDEELGVESLVPIATLDDRIEAWAEWPARRSSPTSATSATPTSPTTWSATSAPDAIVHFAEQRSAPYSMIDQAARGLHADQQRRRHPQRAVRHRRDRPRHPPGQARHDGRVRHAQHRHRGGLAEVTHKGRTDRVLYPKRPGSFYHLSKVHDSHNIEFALPHLGAAGHRPQPGRRLRPGDRRDRARPRGSPPASTTTRVFGTVLNRLVIQAVLGHPLTVYGGGGQTRG